MKGKKLVIAVILALIVCLVLIPTCAFADEPVEQPDETPADESTNIVDVTVEQKTDGSKTVKYEEGEAPEEGTVIDSVQDAIEEKRIEDTNDTGLSITLTSDVSESITIDAGKTVTIDLNGWTLSNTEGKDTIFNNGTLYIVDNSAEKKGRVDNTSHGCAALVNTGVAYLNAGTFDRSEEKGTAEGGSNGNSWYTIKNLGTMEIGKDVTVQQNGSFSSLIDNGWYGNAENDYNVAYPAEDAGVRATLTIKGGNFSGGKYVVKNDDYGYLTINNGVFTSSKGYPVILNWNVAEINNGEFNSDKAIISNGSYTNVGLQGKLAVNGGTFNGKLINFNDGGPLTITGGVYTDEDVETYVADGYVVTENGGKYVVSKYVEPAPVVVPEQTTTKKTDTIVEAKSENAAEQTNVAVEGTTAKITVTDDKGEFVAPQEVTIKSVTALESTGATEASIQLDTKLVLDLDVATIKSASTSDVVTVTNEDSVITVKSGDTALVSVDVKAVVSETEQTVTVKFSENTVKVVCGDTAYSIDLSELGNVGTLTLKLENGVLKVYDKDGNLLKEIEKA